MSRMSVLPCDGPGCTKQETYTSFRNLETPEAKLPTKWYEVKHREFDHQTEPCAYQFCSLECLVEWGRHRIPGEIVAVRDVEASDDATLTHTP